VEPVTFPVRVILKEGEREALKVGVAEKETVCCPEGLWATLLFCAKRAEGRARARRIGSSLFMFILYCILNSMATLASPGETVQPEAAVWTEMVRTAAAAKFWEIAPESLAAAVRVKFTLFVPSERRRMAFWEQEEGETRSWLCILVTVMALSSVHVCPVKVTVRAPGKRALRGPRGEAEMVSPPMEGVTRAIPVWFPLHVWAKLVSAIEPVLLGRVAVWFAERVLDTTAFVKPLTMFMDGELMPVELMAFAAAVLVEGALWPHGLEEE
jgi:hypothetical protein